MFRIQTIASFDQPGLEPYRTLRRSADHAAQGIFVAEGDKVVQRLLASPFTVQSVVLPESRLSEFQPLLAARPEDITVYLAEKGEFLESPRRLQRCSIGASSPSARSNRTHLAR